MPPALFPLRCVSGSRTTAKEKSAPNNTRPFSEIFPLFSTRAQELFLTPSRDPRASQWAPWVESCSAKFTLGQLSGPSKKGGGGGEWNWTPERRGSADAMIRSECPRGTSRPREKKKSRSKRHRAGKKELWTGFSISSFFFFLVTCVTVSQQPAASL